MPNIRCSGYRRCTQAPKKRRATLSRRAPAASSRRRPAASPRRRPAAMTHYAGNAARMAQQSGAARRQLGTYFADLAVYYARLAKLLGDADDAI